MKKILGIWVSTFLATFTLLCLMELGNQPRGWPPSADAQITTFRPLSSFARVTTLDPASAVVPVSVYGAGTTAYVSRGILAGDAFNWFIRTFDASGYLTTVNLSPYLTTFDDAHDSQYITSATLRDRQYVSTTELAGRGYLTTVNPAYITTFDASPYLLTAALPGFQYVSTTALAARGYLTTVNPAYITTYDDSHDSQWISTTKLQATSWTFAPSQQFGNIGTGAQNKWISQILYADGDWSGPAILGNVDMNVGTAAILYLTTGGRWSPYAASLHTFTMPSGMALNAITTTTPGIVLLDGAIARRSMLALGTGTNIYYAGTTVLGSISPSPSGTTGHTVVTVLIRLAEDLFQLLFGRAWGLK